MRPQIRRAELPTGWWWIVHPERGRLIVILDEAVPRGSIIERQLAAMALQMWHQEHRHGIGVFPASTVAAALAALIVTAVSIVYILTGDGIVSGPTDSWAEVSTRPVAVSMSPAGRHRSAPTAAGRGPRHAVPAPLGGSRSGRPAPTPTANPTPDVREPTTPPVQLPPRRPVKTVRRTLRDRPKPAKTLPVKSPPGLRPCELLKLPIGRCR